MDNTAKNLIRRIKELTTRRINLMEVCGTHTMAIARAGIRGMLPPKLRLLSGPGCPVCVTPQETIDYAIALAQEKNVVIATFGDMVRVPGSHASLESYKPKIVYSPIDVLQIAREEKGKEVVFIGVGFETTSPTIAATIIEARKRNMRNLFVLPAFKLIPPALRFIAESPRINVAGLILPGHVSVIIGAKPYEFLARDYHIPGCITGFEPIDILMGIEKLVTRIHEEKATIDIEYDRAVKPEGNKLAMEILFNVFETCDSRWRGIGMIPKSGLSLRHEYSCFDASARFSHIKVTGSVEPKGCICGKVLLGLRSPPQCTLFGENCTPSTPVGACMVSSEGTCAAYFRYGEKRSRGADWG